MHASLASLDRCSFGLDPNVDRIVGGIAQVLHPVLEWREPSRLAGVGVYLLHLSMLIGELEVAFGENDDYPSRMIVDARFLVRAVMDIHDLHPFIFKGQFVVRRLDLCRVLCQSRSEGKKGKSYYPERLGQHALLLTSGGLEIQCIEFLSTGVSH